MSPVFSTKIVNQLNFIDFLSFHKYIVHALRTVKKKSIYNIKCYIGFYVASQMQFKCEAIREKLFIN
jgi:hypothetical protein